MPPKAESKAKAAKAQAQASQAQESEEDNKNDGEKEDDETIKNRIHPNKEFHKNLKVQAASDSRHDLGSNFTKIYNVQGISRIGTPDNEFRDTKGVGWDIVHSVIKTDINIPDDTPPEPNETGKIVYDTIREDIEPIIINFSGFEYKLTTINVNENTKASTLFNFINGPEEDNTELCLIMDATMGPFQKILEKKELTDNAANKKTVYLVVNREAVSDPAGKPNEKDSAFSEKSNKERDIKVWIALDVSEEKVTYPKWIDERENYRSDFFSDFNLELTPVKYGVSKSVMLTFSGKDYADESTIETSASGKLANSKNAMMKLLERIGRFMAPLKAIVDARSKQGGTEQNHKDLQDYFVALQKKRSGDTLIALSFFDTSRLYNANKENFTFNEKRRFILTHDTFNTLPISLTNGADVIYTGATTIYKFERVKEKTDFTKGFFETYIKNKANRNTMMELLRRQQTQYLAKKSEILTEIQTALDTFQNFVTTTEGAMTGARKMGWFDAAQIDRLQLNINSCLQCFFKMCLFRSLYMPTVSVNGLLESIRKLKNKDYPPLKTENNRKIEILKEQYNIQRLKENEYENNFKQFDNSYKKNLVYNEIGKFTTILSGNGLISFGMKINKFTFGASPIIHNFLQPSDGTERFIELLGKCYENPKIARLEKNKAPMKEILSFFIRFTPLLDEEKEDDEEGKETSGVRTDNLLTAAHEEVGSVEAVDGVQSVASPSCVIPYHEGIRERVEETANKLMGEIEAIAKRDKEEEDAATMGGSRSTDKANLELQSFLLLNYMIEMNVYFKGEYNDPNIDIYGQTIPMAGKLFLHAMKHSLDPRSLLFFFMKMSYHADNKASFEKEYKETLKGNTSLYFLPCIIENILYNAFGPDFLEAFQTFSLTYFPIILKTPKLKALVPTIPEMTNPKWESVEEEMKAKIRQVTKNIKEMYLYPTEEVKAQMIVKERSLVAAKGGYKTTKKSGRSRRSNTRRRRY